VVDDDARPDGLTVKRVAGQGSVTLMVAGEVDLSTCERFRREIDDALNSGVGAVLLDLDSVGFMDSSGVGVLIDGRKLAEQRQVSFRVANPRGVVRRVLEVVGVLDVLTG
jgi:anti-sigma B factor antagonist